MFVSAWYQLHLMHKTPALSSKIVIFCCCLTVVLQNMGASCAKGKDISFVTTFFDAEHTGNEGFVCTTSESTRGNESFTLLRFEVELRDSPWQRQRRHSSVQVQGRNDDPHQHSDAVAYTSHRDGHGSRQKRAVYATLSLTRPQRADRPRCPYRLPGVGVERCL